MRQEALRACEFQVTQRERGGRTLLKEHMRNRWENYT